MFGSSSLSQPESNKTKMMESKGQGSERLFNRINSCMMRESCILKTPIGSAWECFKSFEFEKISPSLITSTKFLSGSPKEIGSTYQVTYKDGSTVTYMIMEISELKRSITIDMIECEPKCSFSSMLTSIKFRKVTEDDTTFVCWEALFSNDATSDMISSKKERVCQLFKDMKNYFEKTGRKF